MSQIKAPAKISSLPRLMHFVSAFAKKHRFPKHRMQHVELATEEALVNIFEYAYPRGHDGDVSVKCSLNDGGDLVVEILDKGIPFNILSLSEPDLSSGISERKVGGLGTYLIRKMVDQVKYRREGGRNILTLVLNR